MRAHAQATESTQMRPPKGAIDFGVHFPRKSAIVEREDEGLPAPRLFVIAPPFILAFVGFWVDLAVAGCAARVLAAARELPRSAPHTAQRLAAGALSKVHAAQSHSNRARLMAASPWLTIGEWSTAVDAVAASAAARIAALAFCPLIMLFSDDDRSVE
jgi:hypothetical protein